MKLIIVSIIFLVASCHKEDPIPPDPPIVSKPIFETIWKTRIYDAPLENVGSRNAYFNKGYYIVTGDHYSHPDPTLYAYDSKTGDKMFKINQTGKYQQPGYNMVGQDNIVIISDAKGIAVYNIETKSLLWEDIHTDNNELGLVGQFPIFGNHVYKGISVGSFYGPAKLVRYDLNKGNKEELVEMPIQGIWSPAFSPPAFWIDKNRDTLMLLINDKSNVNYSPQKSPTDLLAINLRTKQIVWKIDNVMKIGTNTLTPPVVYQDDVIFGGDWSVYSVDIPTGKVKWRTQFPEFGKFGNFNSTGLLLHGDKVFGNPDGFDIFCLNAENGNVVWHNKTLAANCTPKMLYNDGMLITTSVGTGNVLIYNAENGNLIHKEFSDKTYHTDVLYDKATNMYFVQDFASAVGFKINKPK